MKTFQTPRQTRAADVGPPAPDDEERARLSLRAHLRLAHCRNLLMRESRRSIDRWGLTLAQFDVLAELERSTRSGFTFGQLSSLLLVTSGNLTGIVDHLESDGLARRKTDRRDRRVVRIVLTSKGRQLVAQVAREHGRDIRSALEQLPRRQQTALEQLLRALSDGLRAGKKATGASLRGGPASRPTWRRRRSP